MCYDHKYTSLKSVLAWMLVINLLFYHISIYYQIRLTYMWILEMFLFFIYESMNISLYEWLSVYIKFTQRLNLSYYDLKKKKPMHYTFLANHKEIAFNEWCVTYWKRPIFRTLSTNGLKICITTYSYKQNKKSYQLFQLFNKSLEKTITTFLEMY